MHRLYSGYCARTYLYGFTLIELMIVLAIMAILATAALPLRELAIQREKEQELRIALRQIRNAIDAYKQAVDDGRIEKKENESGYPKTLDDLVIGMPDAKSTEKKSFTSCGVCRAIRCMRIWMWPVLNRPRPLIPGENAVMKVRRRIRRKVMTCLMSIPVRMQSV